MPPNSKPEPTRDLLCPSAGPGPSSVVFAVRTGDPDRPGVGYLDAVVPATAQLLALAEPADPREVFRFADRCAETGCRHFTGSRCGLGEQVATELEPAVDRIPACRLRSRCRWFAEQGAQACLRCPIVVTLRIAPDERYAEVVAPREAR